MSLWAHGGQEQGHFVAVPPVVITCRLVGAFWRLPRLQRVLRHSFNKALLSYALVCCQAGVRPNTAEQQPG